VVWWEVEVARRVGKVMVVMMTMTLSPNQCRVLRKNFMHVSQSRVFMCAHDITSRDQANIVNTERLLFSLKRKGATKQMRINGFFKKK
jgi:hypothetical protein